MARRMDGGSGRSFPGLRDDLADQWRRLDRAFCLEPLGGPCGICAHVAELEAGDPVEVTGQQVWQALFTAAAPRAHSEFLHDPTVYTLTGDRLAALQEGPTNAA